MWIFKKLLLVVMGDFLNLIWCLGSLKNFCSMTWALSVFVRRKKRNVGTSESFARADELMMERTDTEQCVKHSFLCNNKHSSNHHDPSSGPSRVQTI